MPDVWLDQFVPPLVVWRTVPLAPTAQHVLVLVQAMSFSEFVVPDVCALQLVPPFVVATIEPLDATDQQCVVSPHAMASRVWKVPEFWALHGPAPFVVAMTAPKLPAERQVVVLGQAIPFSVMNEAAAPVTCTDQVPAAAAPLGAASPAAISRASAVDTTQTAGLRRELRSEVGVVL